jgi:hypothetical protein
MKKPGLARFFYARETVSFWMSEATYSGECVLRASKE